MPDYSMFVPCVHFEHQSVYGGHTTSEKEAAPDSAATQFRGLGIDPV